jgi:hypothetical protein
LLGILDRGLLVHFTNSISVGRQVLSKDDSFWLLRRRNILYPQCFDWNAKPLRGGGAFP